MQSCRCIVGDCWIRRALWWCAALELERTMHTHTLAVESMHTLVWCARHLLARLDSPRLKSSVSWSARASWWQPSATWCDSTQVVSAILRRTQTNQCTSDHRSDSSTNQPACTHSVYPCARSLETAPFVVHLCHFHLLLLLLLLGEIASSECASQRNQSR